MKKILLIHLNGVIQNRGLVVAQGGSAPRKVALTRGDVGGATPFVQRAASKIAGFVRPARDIVESPGDLLGKSHVLRLQIGFQVGR